MPTNFLIVTAYQSLLPHGQAGFIFNSKNRNQKYQIEEQDEFSYKGWEGEKGEAVHTCYTLL